MAFPQLLATANRQRRFAAPWSWAGAGLFCGALVVTVVSAPAQWLVKSVNAITRGSVLMSDGAGTVWAGSAQVALTGGAGSRDAVRLPGRVQWTIGLGWGHLKAGLSATCCAAAPVQMQVAPLSLLTFWNGWSLQVQAHQSVWPAAVLAGLGTPWNTVQAEGNLALSTPGFTVNATLDRVTLAGEIALEAQDMRSRLSTLRPLGTYRINVTGGDQPALALTTLKGDLQLSGQGSWNAGRLRFEGEARAETAHAQELSNLLNILGRRDGVRSIITLG
jgi:general secretion pathway protein N